jgi:hypothetical protein
MPSTTAIKLTAIANPPVKTVSDSVTNSHTAILPVIVCPGQSEAISLAPEFITPQDGHEKQDCEVNAAKRWIRRSEPKLAGQWVTLLGDDIYSRQPMCETALASGMNFIFTCLPSSHPLLYEWLESLEKLGEVHHLSAIKIYARNAILAKGFFETFAVSRNTNYLIVGKP